MSETPPEKPPVYEEVPFHLRRSNFFRVVHADGVWYNYGATSGLHLVFYSESMPIPETVYAQFKDGKPIGDNPQKRVIQQGMVRELEVDVIMSLEAAYNLKVMLEQNIKVVEGMMKAQQNKI